MALPWVRVAVGTAWVATTAALTVKLTALKEVAGIKGEIGGYDNKLHCVEAVTGKSNWVYESSNFINGAPAVGQGITVSVAPPRPKAMTGVPHAWASTGTMPKSSSPGKSSA